MYANTRDGLWKALLGLASLVLPAALALASVKDPGILQISSSNPSPYGYTISLLLFAIPDVVLIWWLMRRPEARVERLAFWATVAAVFAVGCVLDFLFAHTFFTFTNPGATLGIRLPAWSFAERRWVLDVLPLEEFGFYSLGALFMMALYAWADLEWMPKRGQKAQERALDLKGKRLLQFHPWSLVLGGALIMLAIVYRKLAVGGDGFPGYFVFLLCIGFIPTSMLYPVAAPTLNWNAFTLMFVTLQLVSVIWEATLGVPYNWWNYHHEQMLGLFIGPWAQLPIESVMMWVVAGWAVAIVYEVFRVFFHQREGTALVRSPPLGSGS